MPLLDHFHQPTKHQYPWSTVNAAWVVSLTGWLNRTLPRDEYRAEANIYLGPRVEADVAEFKENGVPADHRNGPVAVMTAIPPAVLTLPASFPDDIEVEIREEHDLGRLAAVIEVVSPGNKKEPDERASFVAKCVSYLRRGVGLVIVDVVTERLANLHNELLAAVGPPGTPQLAGTPTYVAGYRPVHRRDTQANELEVWPYPAPVGQAIPAVPLGLRGGPTILLDLEGTYTEAFRIAGL